MIEDGNKWRQRFKLRSFFSTDKLLPNTTYMNLHGEETNITLQPSKPHKCYKAIIEAQGHFAGSQ